MNHFFRRTFIGFVLIAAGVLFLLGQTGVIRMNTGQFFSMYWPVIIILVGLNGIFTNSRYGGWAGAYIWSFLIVAVGLTILGRTTGYFVISIGDLFRQYAVPVILVAIGLSMLMRPARRHRRRDWWENHQGSQSSANPEEPTVSKQEYKNWDRHEERNRRYEERAKRYEERRRKWEEKRERKYRKWDQHFRQPGTINYSSFVGDYYIGEDYWELKPMNVSHFAGDTVLDLTKAHIPAGETRINISAFIGDVKVYIPADTEVEVLVNAGSFIGEITVLDRYASGFGRSLQTETPSYQEAESKLRLNISMFIGDIKVQKVG